MASPLPSMVTTASLSNMATMSSLASVGTMGSTAGAEVERFVALYKLDERAAGALRELALQDPQGAQEVMMSPITPEVRNPSGVIHARVMNRTGQSKKATATTAGARVGPYQTDFLR